MGGLVLPHLLFLGGKDTGCRGQLRIEEVGRAFRLLLAGTYIFVDKQRRQLGIHLLRYLCLVRDIRDLERSQRSRSAIDGRRLDEIELNVLTHLDNLVVRSTEEQPLVQMKAIDNGQQT